MNSSWTDGFLFSSTKGFVLFSSENINFWFSKTNRGKVEIFIVFNMWLFLSSSKNVWLFPQEVFLIKDKTIFADAQLMSQIVNNLGRLYLDQKHYENHHGFDKLVGLQSHVPNYHPSVILYLRKIFTACTREAIWQVTVPI